MFLIFDELEREGKPRNLKTLQKFTLQREVVARPPYIPIFKPASNTVQVIENLHKCKT